MTFAQSSLKVGIGIAAGSSNVATSSIPSGGAITYISSDTAIARVGVNDAAVTGVKVGTVTITATQAAMSGVNQSARNSYTLTVLDLKQVQNNLDTTALSLSYGNSSPRTASCSAPSGGTTTYSQSPVYSVSAVSPADAFSVNPSSGVVTVSKPGSGRVIATCPGIINTYLENVKSYAITISKVTPGISIDDNAISGFVLGSPDITRAMTVSKVGSGVAPVGIPTCSSSNDAIAKCTGNGVIHAVAVGGPVTVTVSYGGDDYYSAVSKIISVTVVNPPAPSYVWGNSATVAKVSGAGSYTNTLTASVNGVACTLTSCGGISYGISPAAAAGAAVTAFDTRTGAVTIGSTSSEVSYTITASQVAKAGVHSAGSTSYTLKVTKLPLNTLSLSPRELAKTYGDAAFDVPYATCYAGSLPTYRLASGSGLSLSGSTLTITAANTAGAVVSVTCQGNYAYAEDSASYTVTIAKRTPTLTFSSPVTTLILGGRDATNVATVGNLVGNDSAATACGSQSYSSSDNAVATVSSSGVVHAVKLGQVDIRSTCIGSSNYKEVTSAPYTMTVSNPPLPSLTFEQAGPVTVVQGNSVRNTASSSVTVGGAGAISYACASGCTGITVDATSGRVTVTTGAAVGDNVITASQAAVPGVNQAGSKSYTLTVIATTSVSAAELPRASNKRDRYGVFSISAAGAFNNYRLAVRESSEAKPTATEMEAGYHFKRNLSTAAKYIIIANSLDRTKVPLFTWSEAGRATASLGTGVSTIKSADGTALLSLFDGTATGNDRLVEASLLKPSTAYKLYGMTEGGTTVTELLSFSTDAAQTSADGTETAFSDKSLLGVSFSMRQTEHLLVPLRNTVNTVGDGEPTGNRYHASGDSEGTNLVAFKGVPVRFAGGLNYGRGELWLFTGSLSAHKDLGNNAYFYLSPNSSNTLFNGASFGLKVFVILPFEVKDIGAINFIAE